MQCENTEPQPQMLVRAQTPHSPRSARPTGASRSCKPHMLRLTHALHYPRSSRYDTGAGVVAPDKVPTRVGVLLNLNGTEMPGVGPRGGPACAHAAVRAGRNSFRRSQRQQSAIPVQSPCLFECVQALSLRSLNECVRPRAWPAVVHVRLVFTVDSRVVSGVGRVMREGGCHRAAHRPTDPPGSC